MIGAYEKCIRKSSIWKLELEKKLSEQGSDDVYTDYERVARAFPSTTPHPRSFDFSLIDDKSLKLWAGERGWKAELISENSNQGNEEIPHVLFTRIA